MQRKAIAKSDFDIIFLDPEDNEKVQGDIFVSMTQAEAGKAVNANTSASTSTAISPTSMPPASIPPASTPTTKPYFLYPRIPASQKETPPISEICICNIASITCAGKIYAVEGELFTSQSLIGCGTKNMARARSC